MDYVNSTNAQNMHVSVYDFRNGNVYSLCRGALDTENLIISRMVFSFSFSENRHYGFDRLFFFSALHQHEMVIASLAFNSIVVIVIKCCTIHLHVQMMT